MKPATGCINDREFHKPTDTAAINTVTYQGQLQINCRRGSRDFDIAEVLIFSRALLQSERVSVERYLKEKYAKLRSGSEELVPGGLRPLEMVANPPPVQMFVPGFTVRELPISLKNINNLKYRADGKLVALGYNGRIYLLSDTDGDGVEDKVEPFWERDTLRAPLQHMAR